MLYKKLGRTFLIIFVLVAAAIAFYFLPKSRTGCGSVLPTFCRKCTCERGFIYSPTPIGGGGNMECFLGNEPICEEPFELNKKFQK